uniref:Lipoprotein n=1 Tax=Panagrolaimus sp. PS1159 TaxID=55785 RepID=A0AC35FRE7_9BILA
MKNPQIFLLILAAIFICGCYSKKDPAIISSEEETKVLKIFDSESNEDLLETTTNVSTSETTGGIYNTIKTTTLKTTIPTTPTSTTTAAAASTADVTNSTSTLSPTSTSDASILINDPIGPTKKGGYIKDWYPDKKPQSDMTVIDIIAAVGSLFWIIIISVGFFRGDLFYDTWLRRFHSKTHTISEKEAAEPLLNKSTSFRASQASTSQRKSAPENESSQHSSTILKSFSKQK